MKAVVMCVWRPLTSAGPVGCESVPISTLTLIATRTVDAVCIPLTHTLSTAALVNV